MAIRRSASDNRDGENRPRVAQPRKERLLARTRRIQGQINGVARMIEEDRYCIDILNQIAAARAALDAVGQALLEDHVKHCVRRSLEHPRQDDGAGAEDREAMIEELVGVLRRYGR